MRFKWSAVLLVIWTATLLVAVLVAANSKVKNFDPKNVLHQSALSLSFDKSFVDELSKLNVDLAGSVIHFQQGECFCQAITQSHVNSVEELAENKQFKNIIVNLDEHKSLNRFIPSVPAVAVIDKASKLRYFGPYSSGMFCNQGDGLVEPFIKNRQTTATGATIISQSQGCYCNQNSV